MSEDRIDTGAVNDWQAVQTDPVRNEWARVFLPLE